MIILSHDSRESPGYSEVHGLQSSKNDLFLLNELWLVMLALGCWWTCWLSFKAVAGNKGWVYPCSAEWLVSNMRHARSWGVAYNRTRL